MRIAYLHEGHEANYVSAIRPLFAGHALGVTPLPQEISLFNVVASFEKNKVESCFFSSRRFLQILLDKLYKKSEYRMSKSADAYKNYWGATFKVGEVTYTCMPDLESLYSIDYGTFLFKRYIDKILNPSKYIHSPKLNYEVILTEHIGNIYLNRWKKDAVLIAIDIETRPFETSKEFYNSPLGHGLVAEIVTNKKTKPVEYIAQIITCVGYTALIKGADGYRSETIVIPYEGLELYNLIRNFNNLPTPKVLQNGKYDAIHLICNNLPFNNWRYDTYGMMHSYYAELPRSLDFISSFFLLNHMYWKDESINNLYEYNAKDTHATLWACVAMLQEMPQWAIDNFGENFIQIFPCLTCSLEGFAVDWNEFERVKKELEGKSAEALESSQLIFGETFNPNSPLQVKKLITTFGLAGAESSDKKTMQKFADLSEWHSRLIAYVTNYRKAAKVVSTYFEFPFLGGRWLFDLDPFGTETGRYASKSSSLWVGQQGQNFPAIARSPYIPDAGYAIGAADNEQSESRCTAYISEDKKLMETVETSPDFHKTNASLFFGIPFEKITKEIRTLSKRVNHGANYNMGAGVLIETMGAKNIIKAKSLLQLPSSYSLKETANYLLKCFDNAYPDIKGKYYKEVIEEVRTTSMLRGATGWTRYCFGNPAISKLHLNAYVAHAPQSLSVKIINRAFFKIWHEYQFKQKIIRLKMQKHDEIIWQTTPEHSEIGHEISKIMAEPTIVRGRSMVIPNEPEMGKKHWGEVGA